MQTAFSELQKQFNKISIFIVAHADDWQLFMHPFPCNDLRLAGCKVVFIISTAGDGGMNKKFWKAREDGSNSSVRFCIGSHIECNEKRGRRRFNGHNIAYWSANNSITYFLRLPDGNLDSNGFALGQYQSLAKLHKGTIKSITTIDHSTTYHGWDDLVETMETIIESEAGNISNKLVNYINPDRKRNVNDHPDHVATGLVLQDMALIDYFSQTLFVGYNVQKLQKKLSPVEIFWKAGLMAVYEKAVYDKSGYSTLKENNLLYTKWCSSPPVFVTSLPKKLKHHLKIQQQT